MPKSRRVRISKQICENVFLGFGDFGRLLLKTHAGKEVGNIFRYGFRARGPFFSVSAWAGPGRRANQQKLHHQIDVSCAKAGLTIGTSEMLG